MRPRILSLCSGYGGLDMAIKDFFGAETAAFVEFEAAPSKVLAHHWPNVPNLGDMTKVDWATLSDINIIAGGTPCQDLSAAGKRAGMTEGTRSNLWVQMREAIAVLRPELVIWENVRGAYSARADSEVEREPGLLGDGAGGPALRALSRVLGDLSSLGYDTQWVGVRASDAGAPHGRFRVFVLAYAEGFTGSFGDGDDVCPRCGAVGRRQAAGGGSASDAEHVLGYGTGRAWHGWTESADRAPADATVIRQERGGSGRPAGSPAAAISPSANADDAADDGERSRPGSRIGSAPAAADASSTRLGEHAGELPAEEARPAGGDLAAGAGGLRPHQDWGPYQPAIERWERESGRVAPSPTNADGRNGGHRLSAQFVEWMMGLPAGHVTSSEIGISRNEQLKALGNGVVPQQAHLALSLMWPRVLEAVTS